MCEHSRIYLPLAYLRVAWWQEKKNHASFFSPLLNFPIIFSLWLDETRKVYDRKKVSQVYFSERYCPLPNLREFWSPMRAGSFGLAASVLGHRYNRLAQLPPLNLTHLHWMPIRCPILQSECEARQ